jgi:hypothetical protein
MATLRRERLRLKLVQLLKPRSTVRNQRLQKDSLSNSPNAHTIPLESKLARKPNGLAAAVLE